MEFNRSLSLSAPELIRFKTSVLETIRDVMPNYLDEHPVIKAGLKEAEKQQHLLIEKKLSSIEPLVEELVQDEVERTITTNPVITHIQSVFLIGLSCGLVIGLLGPTAAKWASSCF